MAETQLIPPDFSGLVRLFPLPDLVLFPHVVQPLRVFEPRYVAMLEDALAGDQLIAMALLRPGWERDYEGVPDLHDTVCLGRVLSHSRQADHTYHLLLAGAMRGRIREERPSDTLYRQAEISLLSDHYAPLRPQGDPDLRHELLHAFQELNPGGVASDPGVRQLLKDEVPLGVLTDVISYAVPLSLANKQGLLAEVEVDRRAARLIRHLLDLVQASTRASHPAFPPKFSDN